MLLNLGLVFLFSAFFFIKRAQLSCLMHGHVLKNYIDTKNALGIYFPSKFFKKEVGFNVVYGFAEGIEEKAKTAINAVNSLSNSVVDAARKKFRF